jgi:hypothetical protein
MGKAAKIPNILWVKASKTIKHIAPIGPIP